MSPSKYSYKPRAEVTEMTGTIQVPVSHYVERGRKKFDWLKAFEERKKKIYASSTLGRKLRNTSKSDTSSDSDEELQTKLGAIKLLEKKVDDTPIGKENVQEPVWQESNQGPKLPAMKKENDKN